MDQTEPLVFSIEEAAQKIGVSRATFYALVLPKIRSIKIGRRRVVAAKVLDDFVEKNSRRAA
jgi:excisionase family DNA binding protein